LTKQQRWGRVNELCRSGKISRNAPTKDFRGKKFADGKRRRKGLEGGTIVIGPSSEGRRVPPIE